MGFGPKVFAFIQRWEMIIIIGCTLLDLLGIILFAYCRFKEININNYKMIQYRDWQLRFLQYLDEKPLGSIINLCGGSWGKSWLQHVNTNPNLLYFNESFGSNPMDPGKKVIIISLSKIPNVNYDYYEIEEHENYDDLVNLYPPSLINYSIDAY
jgi:hypothetical protein